MVDHAKNRVSDREVLLGRLLDGNWHNSYELQQIAGPRFGARLHELRRVGFDIETGSSLKGAIYRLRSKLPGRPRQKLVRVFLQEEDARHYCETGCTSEAFKNSVRSAYATYMKNKENL